MSLLHPGIYETIEISLREVERGQRGVQLLYIIFDKTLHFNSFYYFLNSTLFGTRAATNDKLNNLS